MKRIHNLILIAVVSIGVATATALAQNTSTTALTGGAQNILVDKLAGTEGIALCPDGKMFVFDSTKNVMLEVVDDSTVKIFAEGFKGAAGLACGPDGTVYIADYGNGRVTSISADGKTRKVLAEGFKTPNGIAAASDGTVYMSDSTTGTVYKIHPGGAAEKLLDGVNFANGLLLSQDEGLLYIAQTTPNKITVAPLTGDNMGKKKTFATKLQMVDGITADADGNIYACLYSKGDIAKVDKDGAVTIIASGLHTPATPIVKNGALYTTSLNGKGLYKIPLETKK